MIIRGQNCVSVCGSALGIKSGTPKFPMSLREHIQVMQQLTKCPRVWCTFLKLLVPLFLLGVAKLISNLSQGVDFNLGMWLP